MAANLRIFLRLTRAWLLGIVRDRATIFWMLAFPVLFIVIFGLAFSGDRVDSFEIGVVVDEQTPTGRALLDGLRAVEPFNVTTGTLDDELAKLRDGERDAIVTTLPPSSALAPLPSWQTPGRFSAVIPRAATAVVRVENADAAPSPGTVTSTTGRALQPAPSTVVVHHDPSQAATAQIVLPIVRQVVDRVDQQLSGRSPSLTVEERSVRSDDLRFIDFFLPGIIGFSVMQTGMFAAVPLVQLRLTRVLKRFGATPVSRLLVLASQGATRLLLAAVTTVVLMLTGRLLFDINLGGNWPGVASFVLLGGAAFLALGFAISGLARTEEAVPALVQLISFPMMFLAGVFWPIDNFPPAMQVIARLLPLTFLGDGLRQTMVGGAALHPLWLDYLVLLAWLLLGGALAIRFFKWE